MFDKRQMCCSIVCCILLQSWVSTFNIIPFQTKAGEKDEPSLTENEVVKCLGKEVDIYINTFSGRIILIATEHKMIINMDVNYTDRLISLSVCSGCFSCP